MHQDHVETNPQYDNDDAIQPHPQPPPTLEIHEMEEQSEDLVFLDRRDTLRQQDGEDGLDGGSMMNFLDLSENSSLVPMEEGSMSEINDTQPQNVADQVERMVVTADIEDN